MRYPASHKDETRARVLREAARALRLHGPDRVAVADVMREAGLTHGGFYAHFASKEDLVAQAVTRMWDDTLARFDAATSDKPPAQALQDYIDRYLTTAHCDRPGGGCPLAAMAADVPRLSPEARERFEAGAAQLASRIARVLEALGRQEAGTLAMSVLAELVGALVLARTMTDGAHAQALLDGSKAQLLRRLALD